MSAKHVETKASVAPMEAEMDEETKRRYAVVVQSYLSQFNQSQELFSELRLLPQYGSYWKTAFKRAFHVFTKLWKYQQEHREALESSLYRLQRWEIGEIASKIGQIYYLYYLRTSERRYLQEAFIFYDAILNRSYFVQVMEAGKALLVVKYLRYLARFMLITLLTYRNTLFSYLLTLLDKAVAEYTNKFKAEDVSDWQRVLQDAKEMYEAMHCMGAIEGGERERVVLFLDSLQSRSNLTRVAEAIVVCATKQVKFSGLSIDLFRFGNSLEGSTEGAKVWKTENPHKVVLYRPKVDVLIGHMGEAMNQCDGGNMLLFYLHCQSMLEENQVKLLVQSTGPPYDLHHCMTIQDLRVYMRRKLFIVMEIDHPEAVGRELEGDMKGDHVAILCPRISTSLQGGICTAFLTDPYMGICKLLGLTMISASKMRAIEGYLSEQLEKIQAALTACEGVSENVLFTLPDPLLFTLLAKAIFMKGLLQYYAEAHQPILIQPALPPSLHGIVSTSDIAALMQIIPEAQSRLQM